MFLLFFFFFLSFRKREAAPTFPDSFAKFCRIDVGPECGVISVHSIGLEEDTEEGSMRATMKEEKTTPPLFETVARGQLQSKWLFRN